MKRGVRLQSEDFKCGSTRCEGGGGEIKDEKVGVENGKLKDGVIE